MDTEPDHDRNLIETLSNDPQEAPESENSVHSDWDLSKIAEDLAQNTKANIEESSLDTQDCIANGNNNNNNVKIAQKSPRLRNAQGMKRSSSESDTSNSSSVCSEEHLLDAEKAGNSHPTSTPGSVDTVVTFDQASKRRCKRETTDSGCSPELSSPSPRSFSDISKSFEENTAKGVECCSEQGPCTEDPLLQERGCGEDLAERLDSGCMVDEEIEAEVEGGSVDIQADSVSREDHMLTLEDLDHTTEEPSNSLNTATKKTRKQKQSSGSKTTTTSSTSLTAETNSSCKSAKDSLDLTCSSLEAECGSKPLEWLDTNPGSTVGLESDVDLNPLGPYEEGSPNGREEVAENERMVDDDDQEVEDSETEELEKKTGLASSSSDDESTAEEIANRFRPPPHKWSVGRSQRKREYGLRARESPGLFRIKCMGSLHMVQRLELMDKLENHNGCVNCLNFNASGSRLASGSDDMNVTIWDWATGLPVLTFDTKHRANVFQAKFMPLSGDCHIVTCARDGQVRLAELSVRGVCKDTRKLASHKGAAHKLTLEEDSPHVFLTCGEDASVLQIDLREPKPNKLLVTRRNGEKVPLYSIHSNPRNPQVFATSGRDEFCRIYDKRKLGDAESEPVKKFCPHHLIDNELKPNVTCVMYSHDGAELLASYNNEDIYSFDTRHSDGAEYIRRFTGHRNSMTVKGVNWYGGSSEFVVSGSDCGHVFIWDKETEKLVNWMPADEAGVVNCLEPHPTMPVLATSGLDHDVKIWVPSCEAPSLRTEELRKLLRENHKQRREDSDDDTGRVMDVEFMQFIMQHMRRARDRQRRRRENGEGNNGNESTDEDSELDEESDGDGEGVSVPQCRTS